MSQETGTEAAPGEGEATSSTEVRGRSARVLAWLRAELFRPTASGPIGWRKPLIAVVCVAAGVAISLSRTRGAGSLNTIWIEDAKYLLNNALNGSFWSAFTTPISSYYQQPARILTEIAIQFPLTWAPGVMSIFSALEYCMYGLVAYIASGPHLRSPWLRLLIAVPVCMIPLAYTQVNNDLVTVQFFGLFGAFWTVLWIPGTRWGKVLSPLIMLTVSGTAVLSIVFLPLILVRLIVDRSKNAWALAICWALGVLLQLSRTIEGKSNHASYHNTPLFVIQNYAARVVPRALFGERALGGPGVNYRGAYAPLHIINMAAHDALIACAWGIVVVVVVLAITRFTDPNWPLAIVAALFSAGIFVDEMLINVAVVQTRYVIAPALLLYTALVALMRPKPVPQGAQRATAKAALRWLPVTGFAVLLAVAIGLNFRVTNGRTSSPSWTNVVSTAHAACQVPGVSSYLYVHEWWFVTIPCSRVG
jgi:hypothetical protein